jgi:hypothetical protein
MYFVVQQWRHETVVRGTKERLQNRDIVTRRLQRVETVSPVNEVVVVCMRWLQHLGVSL